MRTTWSSCPTGTRLYTEHLDDWNLDECAAACRSTSSASMPVCRIVVVSPGAHRAGLRRTRRAHRPQRGVVRDRLDGVARHRAAGRRQGHARWSWCADWLGIDPAARARDRRRPQRHRHVPLGASSTADARSRWSRVRKRCGMLPARSPRRFRTAGSRRSCARSDGPTHQDLPRRSCEEWDEQCCRLDSTPVRRMLLRHPSGGLSERPMDLVLKTSGQQCPVGSNPTPSACSRGCAPTPHPEASREDPSEPADQARQAWPSHHRASR